MSDSVKMNEMEKLLEEVQKNEWSRGMITKFFIQVLHEGKDENLELLLLQYLGANPTVDNNYPLRAASASGHQKTYYTSLETNFKIPIVRKIIKLLNAVPIPQNIKYTKNFMNSIDSLLNNGKTVHFYPEGSLWPYYDKIRHFKNGAFDFAVRNNVPIIPMVFKFDKQKKISNLIKPKTIITLEILKPVYPNKLIGKKDAILQLKEDVYSSMCEAKNE